MYLHVDCFVNRRNMLILRSIYRSPTSTPIPLVGWKPRLYGSQDDRRYGNGAQLLRRIDLVWFPACRTASFR